MPTVTPPRRNSRVRHPNRRSRGRAEILDWLAAQYTHVTPGEMRAAEQAVTGSSPVADRMQAQAALR